jgi:CBS domain-containing protein
MRVSGFMVPKEKVLTCSPTDSTRVAMDLMLDSKVGAIVVLVTGRYHAPIGIVTKTDMLNAFKDGLTLDEPVKNIMSKDLQTCLTTMNRDQVARVFVRNKNHHAIVVDENQQFQGLVSSWDIAKECAADDRSWPWNRSEDGRFHKPFEEILGSSPTPPVGETHISNVRPVPRRSKMGDSFRGYIDQLLEDPYFD